MKTHLVFAVAGLVCAMLHAQSSGQLAPISQTAGDAAIARGLVRIAELLCKDPDAFGSLHCATVTESNSDFATGLAERIIDEGRFQTAKRTMFKLLHLDEIDPNASTADSFVDWITGSRGLRNLPRPAKAVFNYEPFTTNNLLLFAINPAKEGREHYAPLHVLPPNCYPQLKNAREWRKSMEGAFAPNQTVTKDDLAILREQLKSSNCFVRLCVLFRLFELKLSTFEDATNVLASSKTASETAALTLLLLHQAPTTSNLVADLGAKSLQQPIVVDGVALGAAIHFLDLDEDLIKAAIKYQAFREPGRGLPPKLAASLSYPILSAIGDAVKPLKQPLNIDPNTMLARLLASTRALHQISIDK